MSLAYAALAAFYIMPCPSRLCPKPNRFLSLHKNIEQISTKFAADNHHHEQIKWLHNRRNWKKEKENTRENSIDVSRFGRDVKQVLTPSEWIHKFTAQITADAIVDIISR